MINFPKKHVADSVVERILAAERQLNDVQAQGSRLDRALMTPPGETAALEGLDDAIVSRALGL